jgi:hypothetical protein
MSLPSLIELSIYAVVAVFGVGAFVAAAVRG